MAGSSVQPELLTASRTSTGAPQNLQRWTLTRAIKETLVPPTDYTYPHMG